MPQDREFEIKFQVDPSGIERLLTHPILAEPFRDRREDRLVATYFDTPDGLLRRNRIGLRVRRSGNHVVHTLKKERGSLLDRGEWEIENAAARPNAEWLRGTPLGALFEAEGVVSALEPVFTVEVVRATALIKTEGAILEAALDQGEIRASDRALPVCELEMELKDGHAAGLLPLGKRLVADLPLLLSLASKAERGYGLAERNLGQPTKVLALNLIDSMTIAEAFQAIVQACLHTLITNAALIAGEDRFEGTHKARIAMRRLVAAFKLFQPALQAEPLDRVTGAMKDLSKMLGAARDADVFQAGTFDGAEAEGEIPGADVLAQVMRGLHATAYAALNAALASSHYRSLMFELLAFSIEGVSSAQANEPFEPFVQKRLGDRAKAIVKGSKDLRALSSEAMHDVRKKAKMLRYDLDFFDKVEALGAGSKAFRHLRQDLETLQETLGALHDQDAMREHLRALIFTQARPERLDPDAWARAAFAAGMIAGRPTDAERHLSDAEKAAERLAKTKPFD